MSNQKNEGWGSRLGVIIAVAGSAVGLGNFLRFPGQAAANGGGAFMIPYFCALIFLGIPLCWAEWTMGRYGGLRGFNSAPGVFSVLWKNPLSKYLGTLGVLVPLSIYLYYVLIEAWCLTYAIGYLTGDLMLGSDPKVYAEYFANVTGQKENGALMSGGQTTLLATLIFVYLLNFACIYQGVSKGIEILCTYAMPMMLICAVIVLVRVLTLPAPYADKPDQDVIHGLGFMWNPDFSSLKNGNAWLAAAGQIFFSLSVGFGVIINYASYLKKDDDVVLSGLTASAINEFFEVCLGGMITIPAAFMFLGAVAIAGQGTFGLGFNSLPCVFAGMPGGAFFGFLWFFMLFLAAITSSVSMLQPVIAFFEEGIGLKRHASVAILGLITLGGTAFVTYFSKELLALDTIDYWVGTFCIVTLALVQSFIYAFIFGAERGEQEAHQGAQLKMPKFMRYVLTYVSPLYLVVILIGALASDDLRKKTVIIANSPVAQMSIALIIALWVFLLLLANIAGRRWEKEGRYAQLKD